LVVVHSHCSIGDRLILQEPFLGVCVPEHSAAAIMSML